MVETTNLISPYWQELINHYGYLLMAIGAILEGETYLIIGGIVATTGMLKIEGLILLAVIGSMLHDNFFFLLGRFGGKRIIQKKPNWDKKIKKFAYILEKYSYFGIIMFRFMYGFRTIIPFSFGLSKVSIIAFIFFDLIGAIIWSTTFILCGYYFGKFFLHLLDMIDLTGFIEYHWIISSCIVIIISISIILIIKHLKNKNK